MCDFSCGNHTFSPSYFSDSLKVVAAPDLDAAATRDTPSAHHSGTEGLPGVIALNSLFAILQATSPSLVVATDGRVTGVPSIKSLGVGNKNQLS